MKRFLADVAGFLALQALVAVGFDLAYQRALGSDHYLAAHADKARRLEAHPPPRVLLVGGSSLAFGVNSAALERGLGRPVVNLGLNAGLGLDMILSQAERAMGPGDLVILSPEYRMLEPGRPFDASTVLQQLRAAPGSARDLPARTVPVLLDDGLAFLSLRVHALWDYARQGRPDTVYWRTSFDERGDFIAHLAYGTWKAGDQNVEVPAASQSDDACARLAVFARVARERGAGVLIVPPPIPGDDHERQRERIAGLWDAVSRESGIPVMRGQLFRRGLFFDTAYHLTRRGRRERTRALLDAARSALNGPHRRDAGAPGKHAAHPRLSALEAQ